MISSPSKPLGLGAGESKTEGGGEYHLIDFTMEIGAQCSGDPERSHVELTPSETSVEASSGTHRIHGGFGVTPPTKASRNLFVDEESCLQFVKDTTPVKPNKAKCNEVRRCCSFSWLSFPLDQRSLQSVKALPFRCAHAQLFIKTLRLQRSSGQKTTGSDAAETRHSPAHLGLLDAQQWQTGALRGTGDRATRAGRNAPSSNIIGSLKSTWMAIG